MRCIRRLWPTEALTRPEDIQYIPQRAYLSIGTLRDQLIYPDSHQDMRKKGVKDGDLRGILEMVHLGYLEQREGGLDTTKDWKDVFSGGERQRVNLCRLFYFMPQWAILDECSSAVSSDVEGLLYKQLKDKGITLITVSHRPSLFKYHSYLLQLHGDSWQFAKIGTDKEQESIEQEMATLQGQVDSTNDLKERLRYINRSLGLK